MTNSSENQMAIDPLIEGLYRNEGRRIFASIVRQVRDFDVAEDAMQEAFASAAKQWPTEGVPSNPRSWLVSAGRFRAIDALRRRGRLNDAAADILLRQNQIAEVNAFRASTGIQDDRLRLIFACCHPAIDQSIQIPLTLREVCGLSTEDIASAFLVSTSSMSQRLVRGKAKIRDAGVPISIPSREELGQRVDSVLAVVYLIFNEGYSASSGQQLIRAELSAEAIRLGRLLLSLIPDTEVKGLLALMLLQESRRRARATHDGEIVLLEEQDRTLWDRDQMQEGQQLVSESMQSGDAGPYTIQAAIAAVHAKAPSTHETDWAEMVTLYDALFELYPTPIVALNRAVAIAMRDGPQAGLQIIDSILERGELVDYHLAHAARADLCRRLGQFREAKDAYERARELAKQEPERRFLTKRLALLPDDI
jgi:RNA polymerase sigma-70 factor (ECF subfamily)